MKHPNLKAELLYLIGRASAPLTGAELYERCELADEATKVSKAIANLVHDGKIERAPGEGRARYRLVNGVKDRPLTGVRPAAIPQESGPPKIAPQSLADQIGSLNGAGGKTVRQPDAEGSTVRPELVEGPEPAEAGPTGRQDPDQEADIARGLDQVERQLEAERLADAILARLKRQLAPTLCEMEAAACLDRLNVHVHIDQVDIHLGGL